MKTKLFKITTLFLVIFVGLSSCKKEDNGKAEEVAEIAKSGQLTCKINGKVYAHNGGGYVLKDNHSFVKAEKGTEQVSVNFYGMREGDYVVSDDNAETAGNASLQYYTGGSGPDRVIYKAKSGKLKITKYEKTGGFKVSGTFSGKFEKYVGNTGQTPTGEMIDVTDGSFTDIALWDQRPKK